MNSNGGVSAEARELRSSLASIADSFSGLLSISIHDIRMNAVVEWRGDEVVPLASVAKLAVLDHCLDLIEEARTDHVSTIGIAGSHRVGGSGVLKMLPSVASLPFEDIARLMICVSDNIATNALVDWGGGAEAITNTMRRRGFGTLTIHSAITGEVLRSGVEGFATGSPADVRRLVERLCSSDDSALAVSILAEQQYRDLVTRYWCLGKSEELGGGRQEVVICSKTGFYPGLRSEAGVVLECGVPELGYAVVASGSADLEMGPESEPAIACGRVGVAVSQYLADRSRAAEWEHKAGLYQRLDSSPYLRSLGWRRSRSEE